MMKDPGSYAREDWSKVKDWTDIPVTEKEHWLYNCKRKQF